MNGKKLLWQAIGLILVALLVGCGSVPNEPILTSTPELPSATPTLVSLPATTSPRVLILIRSYNSEDMPYMTDNELVVMIDMLKDVGFEFWIASRTHDPYESETKTIIPDFIFNSVDVADFDAVILPCLAAGTRPGLKDYIEFVAEFDKQEKVIAAQHGARGTLYQLGIITDDQWTRIEVLQNGRVITSGCGPYMARSSGCEDSTRELIEKLIATVNEGK